MNRVEAAAARRNANRELLGVAPTIRQSRRVVTRQHRDAFAASEPAAKGDVGEVRSCENKPKQAPYTPVRDRRESVRETEPAGETRHEENIPTGVIDLDLPNLFDDL